MRRFQVQLLVLFASASPALAADLLPHTVTTAGECVRRVEPDRGELSLGVQIVKPTAKEANAQATKVYEKIRDLVKKSGLKDLELMTTGVSLSEEKEWRNNSMVNKGYRASASLSVSSSEVPRLGELIVNASELGANSIGGLTLFLSTAKSMRESRACLEEAVADSKSKAESLVKTSGRSLGRPLQIIEKADHADPVIGGGRFAKMSAGIAADAEQSMAVESKPIEIRAAVTAIYELK
jgi:uncharacterized protein